MIQKIKDMLLMQNKLNIKTCGENWTSGICKKTGKPINWDMAILDECAELLGSMDWKHWKNGKNDVQNQRLEIVDIWHFLMSSIIKNNVESDFDVTHSVDDICKIAVEAVLEPSMDTCILGIANSKNSNMIKIQYMFIIMKKIGMSFDQLHSLYMAKNWLNEFRANNGYREGTYVKNWKLSQNGETMEDNDILAHLIGNHGIDMAKTIFELRYKEMIDRELNLCDSCKNDFASCTHVCSFGSGKGDDNVVTCDGYEKQEV